MLAEPATDRKERAPLASPDVEIQRPPSLARSSEIAAPRGSQISKKEWRVTVCGQTQALSVDVGDLVGHRLDSNPLTVVDWTPQGWINYEDRRGVNATVGGPDTVTQMEVECGSQFVTATTTETSTSRTPRAPSSGSSQEDLWRDGRSWLPSVDDSGKLSA